MSVKENFFLRLFCINKHDPSKDSSNSKLGDLPKTPLIKAFEFTYEIAWITLKDYLLFQGQELIAGPRDTIREAFQIGLIEDGEGWMKMMRSRNKTVHTYNEEIADEVAQNVTTKYFYLLEALEGVLNKKIDDLLLPYKVDICLNHTIKNSALRNEIKRWGKTIYKRNSC